MHKTLGQKIKELRRRNKMTQSELGQGLVTPSMISQIEADKAIPSNKLLAALADRLGVSLQYFLDDIQTKIEKSGRLKYARMLMEAKNFKNASQLLEELLADPIPQLQTTEIKLDLAYCHFQLSEFEKALALYEEILHDSISQSEPVNGVKALRAMGMIEYKRGNLVLAHFHWNKAVTAAIREVSVDLDLQTDVMLLLAKAQNRLGDNADALETLRKLQSILEKSNDILKLASLSRTFSEVYRDLGLFKKAEEYARDAIAMYDSLNMRAETMRMNIILSQILDQNGRSEDALGMLEDFLGWPDAEIEENIASIHSVIAGIFFRLEKYDLARTHCEKALAYGNDDYEASIQAYRILANICFKQEQYTDAISNCEQLIHLCQKQNRVAELTRAFTLLSDIYKRQGNYVSATETFLRMKKSVENNLREKIVV